MKLPDWLYRSTSVAGTRIRRWGREPVLVTCMDDPDRPSFPASWAGMIGPFHWGYGPAEGIRWGYQDARIPYRMHVRPNGIGIAVGWERGEEHHASE